MRRSRCSSDSGCCPCGRSRPKCASLSATPTTESSNGATRCWPSTGSLSPNGWICCGNMPRDRTRRACVRPSVYTGSARAATPPRWSAAAPGSATRSAWQRYPIAAPPPFTTRPNSRSRPSACWPIRWVTSTPGPSHTSTSPRSCRRCPARERSSSTCAPTHRIWTSR